jgi:hypothetical protein
MPSPVKSGLKEIPSINSKIKDERESGIREVSNFQQPYEVSSKPVVSSVRKTVPKPPFFSKITNDVQTINTFFYHKFS